MRGDRDGYRTAGSRPLLFAFILACHAALIFIAQRGLIHLASRDPEPLLLFPVTPQTPEVLPRAPTAPSQSRVRSPPRLASTPSTSLDVPAAAAAPRSPLDIDWSAEAALAAQHQTDMAAAPGPRSLDDHHGRKPLTGLNSAGPYQFGWDYAATHRVETSQGVPIIHLGDRCVVGFLLVLPFFGCGFGGEIPVDGDLFKHMHDPPADSPVTPP